MHIQKKSSVQGDWAKVGVDITDRGMVKILDAGQDVENEFGKRLAFQILTKNGQKVITMNQTSLNNLADAYGDESESWIGKMAKTYIIKQKIGEKLKNVVYLCGKDWFMEDDGSIPPMDITRFFEHSFKSILSR